MYLIRLMKVVMIASVTQILLINSANAYECKDSTGKILQSSSVTASSNVYVNLEPTLSTGQNLVVDMSSSISCRNTNPTKRIDNVRINNGSAYGGVLKNFTGTLKYYGVNYPFPTTSDTNGYDFTSGEFTPWNVTLLLTPSTTAGGVIVEQGSLFASLVMYQVGSNVVGGGDIHTATFTWNLYANNSVIVPTGTCDVSSRNLTVQLPEYPGNTVIPLTVYCTSDQNIDFYLSGSTESGTSEYIFSNTYTGVNSASGVGIQLLRNGNAIKVNEHLPLGIVGTSPVSLGLTAGYARTSGQVAAGGVQSIIGVTFVYH